MLWGLRPFKNAPPGNDRNQETILNNMNNAIYLGKAHDVLQFQTSS